MISVRGPLKEVAFRLMDQAGGLAVVGHLTRRWPRLLMYHRFSRGPKWRCMDVAVFEQQVAYLRKHFPIVDLDAVASYMSDEQPLPERAVAITVDDAFEDFFTLALPVLKKYRVPATLYVPTDFVDGERSLWPDRLHALLLRTTESTVLVPTPGDLSRRVTLDSVEGRRAAWEALADYWIERPELEREAAIAELALVLNVADCSPLPDERAMSWQQVDAAAKSGIAIGSHTVSHPALAREPAEVQAWQARESKKRIEAQLNCEVRHFCYPHGRAVDYDAQSMQAVRDAGYSTAVAAFADDRPLAGVHDLRRHGVPENPFRFRRLVWGVPYLRAQRARA